MVYYYKVLCGKRGEKRDDGGVKLAFDFNPCDRNNTGPPVRGGRCRLINFYF